MHVHVMILKVFELILNTLKLIKTNPPKVGKRSLLHFLNEENKVNPIIRDSYGKAPIHIAYQHGHFSIAKYLIEKQNVDPEIKDGQKKNCFLYCV